MMSAQIRTIKQKIQIDAAPLTAPVSAETHSSALVLIRRIVLLLVAIGDAVARRSPLAAA